MSAPGAGCAKPECKKPILSNGLCSAHYHRQYRKAKKATVSKRSKALARLVAEYPDRFRELLVEEMNR